MIAEAFDWWRARMAEVLSPLLQRPRARKAVVVVAGSPTSVVQRNGGRETALGSFNPNETTPAQLRRLIGRGRRKDVIVHLRDGALLETTLALPIAARRELRRVVRYQLDRVTPFSPEEVFWDCAEINHGGAAGQIRIRLALTPRAPLLDLIGLLRSARLQPIAIEGTGSTGDLVRLPLNQTEERSRLERQVTVSLAALCCVLALVAAVMPLALQQIALQRVESRIADLKPSVAEVTRLRAQIAATTAGRDTFAGERDRVGDALRVVDAVTETLPDNTFLTDLSLRQRQLTITGQSSAAPALLSLLAMDPAFRNPGFAAPVTRDPAGADVFSIHAEVVP